MARGTIRGWLTALLTAGTIPATFVACSARGNDPNVIVLLTDDQGYSDVGAYGCKDISTPNLDRLAAEGLRFTNFYAASPVCTPSRAALLTGSYPKRIGMGAGVYFPNDQRGMNPEEITIADMLSGDGYDTMAIGKWHLGRPAEVLPTAQGFDHYYGVPYSNDMTPDHFAMNKNDPWPRLPLMQDTTVIDDGEVGSYGVDQRQLTKLYTQKAVEFIESKRHKKFFLYLAYNQPHYPNIYGEGWTGSSDRGKYGDAVEEIDWSVGEILSALRRSGIDNKTIVVFTSDNGPWKFVLDMPADKYGHWSSWSDGTTGSAAPLSGWKSETYEGGQRVPAIVRWPGRIPEGTVSDALAANIDILPTIAELCGVDASKFPRIDGHSLADSLLRPETAGVPREYFLYYDSDGLMLRAIRNAEGYKLRLYGEDNNTVRVTELYDLNADISESVDIADKYPETVAKLREVARETDNEIEANIRPEWVLRK